jgi:outer membrane protein TolC
MSIQPSHNAFYPKDASMKITTLQLISPLILLTITLSSHPLTLTLDQAIERGVQKRSVLKAIIQEEKALSARSKAALSQWLPQLNISTGVDNAGGNGTGKTPSFFQFSGTQLLFSGANPYDRYAVLDEQKKSIEAKYQATKDSIRFEIETSFLLAWLTKEQKKIITALIQATKSTFDQRKAEYAEKLLDQTSWYQAQATFAAQAMTIENYTKQYQNQLTQLCFSMGESEPTLYHLTWQPAQLKPLKKIHEYLTLAFAHRKEIKIIEKQISSLQKQSNLALKNYLPSVSAFGTVYLQEGREATPSSTKTGGLRLSWNFFDGLQNHFQAEAFQHDILQKELTIAGLKKQISKEIHQAYNDLLIKHNLFKAENFKLRAAKSDWDKKNEEVKVGIATLVDLDAKRVTLEEARFSWISTRVTLAIAEQNLLFTAGYPVL